MKILIFVLFLAFIDTFAQKPIRVGSKHFNEGYIISEIISQLLENEGYQVERQYNLGGTLVCFEALRNNAIDIYPEYSGTISAEILKQDNIQIGEISRRLADQFKMGVSKPFGFNNTYALVVKKELSDSLKIRSISDLRNRRTLSLGLSYEFLKRQDGWDNLNTFYQLNLTAKGLEHGLAYQALDQRSIDITDAYSTDGEIQRYHLVVLADNENFFPKYEALAMYQSTLDKRVRNLLDKLTNTITEQQMQSMNSSVLYSGKTFAEVATDFLESRKLTSRKDSDSPPIIIDVLHKIGRHLFLTFVALALAVIFSLPLGVTIYWKPKLAKIVLYLTGLLQTIPSIALLAIMIPLFGIGAIPAIIALFLYAILPIIQNTLIGLQSVDPLLKKVADGLGMNANQKLRWIELPLALPIIIAGIRTAAVVSIGTATLAAFIGAGGLGEFIVTGLALNNTDLILRGAVPAALLALLVEFTFTLLERVWMPPHLR